MYVWLTSSLSWSQEPRNSLPSLSTPKSLHQEEQLNFKIINFRHDKNNPLVLKLIFNSGQEKDIGFFFWGGGQSHHMKRPKMLRMIQKKKQKPI